MTGARGSAPRLSDVAGRIRETSIEEVREKARIDEVVGDYVTLAPRVSLNGNVVVEDHVYVGTGAVIRQGTPDKPLVLGRGCIIGMGAVVTKDVAPGVTVVGNPARPLEAK